MDRRYAMEAMVRLTKDRGTLSPATATNAATFVQNLAPVQQPHTTAPVQHSRDDVILSLKRNHLKIQKAREGLDLAINTADDPATLPLLCSVVGQVQLHSHSERAKSPTTPIKTKLVSQRITKPAALSVRSPKHRRLLEVSTPLVDQHGSLTDIDTMLAGSLVERPSHSFDSNTRLGKDGTVFDSPRSDCREHDRILRSAGYINSTDFEDDDERQLAIAHAKKIANRRALHRSLHSHQPPPSAAIPPVHEYAPHISTPPRKNRANNFQTQTPPPPSITTPTTRRENILAGVLSKYSSSRIQLHSMPTQFQTMRKTGGDVGLEGDVRYHGRLANRSLTPIPMPTSELVNRTLTMLDGIDSIALTTSGGNCFRLSSDIQFSLKGAIR